VVKGDTLPFGGVGCATSRVGFDPYRRHHFRKENEVKKEQADREIRMYPDKGLVTPKGEYKSSLVELVQAIFKK
jgi:hypothetical protein